MNAFESENVAVNMPLIELIGLRKMLDLVHGDRPVFDNNDSVRCNVYRLTIVAIVSVFLAVNLVTFFNTLAEIRNGAVDDTELMLLLVSYTLSFRTALIAFVFVYSARDIWSSFDAARIGFLASPICRRHDRVLWQYRQYSTTITNFFTVVLNVGLTIWCSSPFLLTAGDSSAADGRRENIFNLLYPVTARFYNDYYPMFYAVEAFIIALSFYFFLIFNVYSLSFCCVFIAQYEVVALAYADVGYDKTGRDEHQGKDCYDDFKSILIDHQKLHLNLKLFYSIIRKIIIISVITNSTGFIYMSYLFVVIFTSSELFSFFLILKLSITLTWLFFDLFITCYLLDRINTKKDIAESAIYNCNWIDMCAKHKKLVLLSMRMHDANQLVIKITPKRVVNLQLFSSVAMTSYNTISFMLKSRSKFEVKI